MTWSGSSLHTHLACILNSLAHHPVANLKMRSLLPKTLTSRTYHAPAAARSTLKSASPAVEYLIWDIVASTWLCKARTHRDNCATLVYRCHHAWPPAACPLRAGHEHTSTHTTAHKQLHQTTRLLPNDNVNCQESVLLAIHYDTDLD